MSARDARVLGAAVAEIEAHVAESGWDHSPVLFALVRAGQFAADDPQAALRLDLATADPDALTPVEQDGLPEGPLDETLAHVAWPDEVAGCAVSSEIVLLPPSAEGEVGDDVGAAAAHPDRREARLVAGVLRDGTSAVVLRLRGADEDDLLTGADLAPNLVEALHNTLR
ncbi:MAG: hypothetical protein QOG80_3225 [Pseudonocardiales bacterium]|jgi:hypothetical protein|nr:hypothetical protein [Pseudonocardiales bacterium]